MEASTSFSAPSLSDFRKRSNPNESENEGPAIKLPRYYFVLESESDPPTDDGNESVYSVQNLPTDSAKDTSDLSSTEGESIVYTISGVTETPITRIVEEYEPASMSEREDIALDILSSASDGENVIQTTIGCEVVVIANDEDTWADSSSISSSCEPPIDPELSLRDYWSCVQCNATNNNPLFRYCEKCFKVRKDFFPPRPRRKNKKRKQRLHKKKGYRNSNSFKRTVCDSSVTQDVDKNVCSPSGSNNLSMQFFGNKDNVTSPNSKDGNNDRSLCEICLTRPKDGLFVHGRKLGHMFCCYQCSKKVWKGTGRCPLCNCKISQVIKVIS